MEASQEFHAPSVKEQGGVLTEAAVQREVAEVQAAMTIAKRFPRDQAKAVDRILIACQRPGLAEAALYSFARGGTEITGPSIRLAEAAALSWGNISFGIRELDQRFGESTVEAFAVDLETNTRQIKVFQVKHVRQSKAKGVYALSDPRDIYEMVANQGARRLRACILGIIPGDVIEAAVTQCEATLKAKADISPEAVQKMLKVFAEYSVTKEMVEKRIQRKIESITPAQIINLRKIYNSLKDGMSTIADWFEVIPVPETEIPKGISQADRIKQHAKRGRPSKTPEIAQEPPIASTPLPETETTSAASSKPPVAISPETMERIHKVCEEKAIDPAMICADAEVSALKELTEAEGVKIAEFYEGN